MRITLFDNHDSFTWNLAHDLGRFGWTVNVVREGAWTADQWDQTDALVLSPGPGLPEEHAQLMDVTAEAFRRGVPTLGVCLGMQALAVHAGGALQNLARSPLGDDCGCCGRHVRTVGGHVARLGAVHGDCPLPQLGG